MVPKLNRQRIREHVIESLCEIRGDERSKIDHEIENQLGDLRIDSKEGEAVCAIVEDALDLGELVEAADLQPEQVTSVESLTRLFEEHVAERSNAEEKDAA